MRKKCKMVENQKLCLTNVNMGIGVHTKQNGYLCLAASILRSIMLGEFSSMTISPFMLSHYLSQYFGYKMYKNSTLDPDTHI